MTKSSELALAEFLDRCCARYSREPSYRARLRRELDKKQDTRTERRAS